MVLPVGQPVHIELTTADVVHSFYVPQAQGPAPPGQRQRGDGQPARIGDRVRSGARRQRHADPDRVRDRQRQGQTRVDHRRGNPPQPLPQGRHIQASRVVLDYLAVGGGVSAAGCML
jgi:hypothetical protein